MIRQKKHNIFNEKVEVKEVVKTEVKENKVKIDKVSIVHKNKFDDSLFKKIRVENALSDFNKGILRDILGSIDSFKNYVLDNELGKYASMIMEVNLRLQVMSIWFLFMIMVIYQILLIVVLRVLSL